MAFHHRPHAIRRGIIGRAVVQKHRRAEQQRAIHEPGSHHPTHVRHPIQCVGRFQIEPVKQILRRFDGKAAMRMHRALGLARCAARVNEHQQIFRVRALGAARSLPLFTHRHDFIPPMIARCAQLDSVFRARQNNHMLNRRTLRDSFIRCVFHWHNIAASKRAVGGEQCFRARVVQTRCHRARTIAAKERQKHRADFRNRQHGNDDFGRHWHQHANRVPFFQTERA